MPFHSCGGIGRSGFSLQKRAHLQCFGRLVCSPLRVHEVEGLATGVEHQIELTAESLWSEVAGRLRGALNDTTYGTWFGEAQGLELDDDRFVLAVPNDFTRDWIEGHFLGLIGAAIRDVTGRERPIELRVSELRLAARAARLDERRAAASLAVPPVVERIPPSRPESGGFNSKYTFDSFVIGSSNRFAHAAALAVAEAPAQAYNPLFIYGSTGLGKTHLLQAVAQYVSEHTSELSVRYITSETFMNDFINSLRDKRIEGFKQRYRTYDVLLIDDVQFFEHKERIQEEFFHTFNSLYEAGSQIVMSSDRPPRDIATLEARLRSRFEWGLITDIQPPDLETRIAILRKKVKTDGIHVPDPQVLDLHRQSRLHQHSRARRCADTRRRLLVPHRPRDVRRARAGRAQGRLPARRSRGGLDQAHPGPRRGALQHVARGALRRQALAEHRLPAPGRDVPLARAHRLLAPEDRQGVRGSRPHDRHPRNVEDRASHS